MRHFLIISFVFSFLFVFYTAAVNAQGGLGIVDPGTAAIVGGDTGSAPPPPSGEQSAPAPQQTAQRGSYSGDILTRGWWGPGGYVDPIKLTLYVLIYFLWVFCASWMNGDMERLNNPNREAANLAYVGAYLGLGLGLMFVPLFEAACPIIFLVVLVPTLVYVVQRNRTLPPHLKVLTGEHLFYIFAVSMNKIGMKIKVKPRLVYEVGSPIEMEATGFNLSKEELTKRLVLARNSPGYNEFREHLYDAITSNATTLMFDFTPESTQLKHLVDGVWLNLAPIPRVVERGKTTDKMEDALIAMKLLIGGKPEDRRSSQKGTFTAIIRKKTKYGIEFVSQGTKTGEAAMLQITAKKVPFQSMEALGIRPDLKEKLMANLNAEKGIFIVSAPPANGLRSSMDVFSRCCDRFTRDVINVEDRLTPSEEIENIVPGIYDSSKGETPLTVLPDIVFKEPKALIVRDMTALPVLEFCCKEVDNERIFITMIRSNDGVEAIFRFLAQKIPAQTFLPRLNAVVCQRLIRKLCPDCKEPFQPPPQLLQQLGLRPDQVRELHRKRTPLPEPEERKRGICLTCSGIGYMGRTAMYELIEMNDAIREAIITNPDMKAIRQLIINQKQRGFMHDGVQLLLKGEISVDELSRVMKLYQ
ncbi:MAG: hypothetical protein FWE67_02235 [Planctomycetaceae bacterium]|nr:hypothetical protein [Planctomycetaceae bacterium]